MINRESDESLVTRVLPGATLGMVGGGQLGRMFAVAAMTMGYRVVVLAGNAEDPAAQVASEAVVGDLTDQSVVEQFARKCSVVTLEFENIPSQTIDWCAKFAPTHPSCSVLATAQDRLIEKRSMESAGLPVAPFAEVDSAESVIEFSADHGWPVILKTARSGYDGKGQHRIESPADARAVPWNSADSWVAEKFIPFDCEASVIVGRSSVGETKCFPVFENRHRNHILDISVCPAGLSKALERRAAEIAIVAAEHLDLIGILCVELFVVGESLMINEIAPRPHNSGHLTIEACHASQFEQHVRAVCGLPLGNPNLKVGGAAMANLLGDLWQSAAPDWHACLGEEDACLHLYGKAEAKQGRKMGHLTAVAETSADAVKIVERSRHKLDRTH